MKKPVAIRKRNTVFNLLSLIISFTFLTTWLPFLRALFDGKSYQWGTQYYGIPFSGKGLTMDYLILIVFLMGYFGLFTAFNWIKNRRIFYALLCIWWLHSFGNLLFDILKNGDSTFHGDTLNIHVSIAAFVIPLAIIALGLVLFMIRKDQQLPTVQIPWNRSNTMKAVVILGPLPLQAIFFATGTSHGITDQIAVIIAIAQCFLIPLIFNPSKSK
ncbi:hypothetical protein [Spongiimicrobium salis]|uniref:hypothetical protein n=1 Tax=Spongiimicrobium salis TaxID=1667022 RepID=UPI00374CC433